MWKKIIGLMLSVVCVFSAMVNVSAQGIESAAEQYEPPIHVNMAYTKSTRADLTISYGQASATAVFYGYNGITTKVTITMTLQKKGLLGLWWSDELSWTETFNYYNATMNRNTGVSGGTYRVKAVYTAYSGTNSETITEYSGNVKY